MKILIIADIHDNLVNLKKCLAWAKNNLVEKIICCGDVTNEETIAFLSNNFPGEIFLVRGNMEIYEDEYLTGFKNINYLGRCGVCEVGGKKIGVCHEPDFLNDVLKIESNPVFVFYGHTHKPWMETRRGVEFVNPGTLGGVFQRASFAVWDLTNNKIELKILDNLTI